MSDSGREWPSEGGAVFVPSIGSEIALAIADEVKRSGKHGKTFASMHEAYAVLLEEVDELWDICKQKRKFRDREKIEEELVQIAAMAIKALHSMDNFIGGNV